MATLTPRQREALIRAEQQARIAVKTRLVGRLVLFLDRFILETIWQCTPDEIAIEEQNKASDMLANALNGMGAPSGDSDSTAA